MNRFRLLAFLACTLELGAAACTSHSTNHGKEGPSDATSAGGSAGADAGTSSSTGGTSSNLGGGATTTSAKAPSSSTGGAASQSCGDGAVEGDEACDDDNTEEGDGCSPLCTVEDGFTCSESQPSFCVETCGDSHRVGAETSSDGCDDGNTQGGDGCGADCAIEFGWSCNDEAPTQCSAVCGDGLTVGPEAAAGGCDDQNTSAEDGCDESCRVEPGWFCSDAPSICEDTCGDGVLDGAESCDDTNLSAGDGCLACAVEMGWTCEDEPSVCSDVDECATSTHNCHVHAKCMNSTGLFDCNCDSGYEGDGVSCSDIDECDTDEDNCDDNATCSDIDGGFSCECNDGFDGNGVTCSNIDECDANEDNCDDNATCSDSDGSFSCECNDGFGGDGVSCSNVDECDANEDNCDENATCSDTDGSFSCECNDGYAGDGVTCSPVVVQVAAGGNHTCVIYGAGSVRCWGWGLNGRLGYGDVVTIGDNEDPKSAGDVNVGGPVKQIAAGGSHTCALLSSGAVRCWGFNSSGQLGYGHTEDVGDDEDPASEDPVNVGGTVTQITAGASHSCALLSTGAVRCWGYNANGQLGYGHTDNVGDDEDPASEETIDLDGTVIQVAAGDGFNCAVLSGGAVRCWGAGGSALGLGNGSTAIVGDNEVPSSIDPVEVGGAVSQVDLDGFVHVCAHLSTGSVRCWGGGGWGALGYGNTDDIGDDETPADAGNVSFGGTAAQVTVGAYHSCVRLTTGAVRCWGYGISGRLGYGNTLNIGDDELPISQDITLDGSVAQMATGMAHNCALMTSGQVRCWGLNSNGQLGYGTMTDVGDNETPASVGHVEVLPE